MRRGKSANRAHASQLAQACCLLALLLVALPTTASASRCTRWSHIGCGETTDGEITSDLPECFTFSGRPDEVVSISVRSTGAPGFFTPVWALYSPSGAFVDSSDFLSPAGQPTLTEAGLYTLEVSDQGRNGGGTYAVTLQALTPTLDGQPACGEPIACGETKIPGPEAAREIAFPSDSDVFHFRGRPDEVVSISVRSTEAPGFFTPAWALYSPSGAFVGAGDFFFLERQLTLTEAGIYTLEVAGQARTDVGSYAVTLQALSPTLDGQPACGEPIACGETKIPGPEAAREIAFPSDSDVFHFRGRPDEVVSISVRSTEAPGFFTPAWALYSSSGAFVGAGDFFFPERQLTLTEAGIYTLEVAGQARTDAGSYAVTLQALTPTLDGQPACGTYVGCSEASGGELRHPSDSDVFHITGQAGDLVTIDLEPEEQTAFSPRWSAFSPGGDLLHASAGSREIELPLSGSYSIEVTDVSRTAIGFYRLAISGGCDAPPCGNGTIEPWEGCDAAVAQSCAPRNTCTQACACVTDAIFSDGFESCDLSRWSSVKGSPGNLTVSPFAALDGSCGLAVDVDDGAGSWIQDDSPADEGVYHLRFHLDPSQLSIALNGKLRVVTSRSSRSTIRPLELVLRQGTTTLLQVIARGDDGSPYRLPALEIGSTPTWVEVSWVRATAPGTNDGFVAAAIDGVNRAIVTSIDNDRQSIDSIRLGAIGRPRGVVGQLRIDSVKSSRKPSRSS